MFDQNPPQLLNRQGVDLYAVAGFDHQLARGAVQMAGKIRHDSVAAARHAVLFPVADDRMVNDARRKRQAAQQLQGPVVRVEIIDAGRELRVVRHENPLIHQGLDDAVPARHERNRQLHHLRTDPADPAVRIIRTAMRHGEKNHALHKRQRLEGEHLIQKLPLLRFQVPENFIGLLPEQPPDQIFA